MPLILIHSPPDLSPTRKKNHLSPITSPNDASVPSTLVSLNCCYYFPFRSCPASPARPRGPTRPPRPPIPTRPIHRVFFVENPKALLVLSQQQLYHLTLEKSQRKPRTDSPQNRGRFRFKGGPRHRRQTVVRRRRRRRRRGRSTISRRL